MKKILTMIMCICISFSSTVVFAKSGDIVTHTKFTNIAAYINHFAIQSYNIDGITCVGAEDLGNFGFNVEWEPTSRSLYITRNYGVNEITQYSVPYETDVSILGQDDAPVYETDIKTFVNGKQAVSYNIGGKTVVDFSSLSAFGKVEWNDDIRALKLWVEDGLKMNWRMQPLKQLPRKRLYSADGRTIDVLNSEVDAYLKVGWFATKEEAQKSRNQQFANKFYVGQRVQCNLIMMCKYGVVDAVDTANGKVKVYWTEIRDSYGNVKNGSAELMFFGLNSSTWEDASMLTPIR